MAEFEADGVLGEGWECVEDTERTLAETPLVTVRSHLRLYEDRALRKRVREATGIDAFWRSVFSSHLRLTPASAAMDLVLRTIVRPEARKRFAADLRERGFRDVEEQERSRRSLGTGTRAELTRYTARSPLGDSGREARMEALLLVWNDDGTARIAGGVYPVEAPGVDAEAVGLSSPDAYRQELLGVVRRLQ